MSVSLDQARIIADVSLVKGRNWAETIERGGD